MDEYSSTEDTLLQHGSEETYLQPLVATPWQFLWLCALVLSFCYERPLAELTAMDRVNPRFFDVVFLIGVFGILPGLTARRPLIQPFKYWIGIVAVFCVCAAVWSPFFPFYYGKYSIFFALKYLQGLLAVYMALQIPISTQQKKILHYMVIIGGIVVALYAVPGYQRGGGRLIFAKGEKELEYTQGAFFSSLGLNYFHVAMFSTLSSVMAIAMVNQARTTFGSLFWFGLGVFVGWPAFFCGARAGVVGCLFGWAAVWFFSKASAKGFLLATGILAFSFMFLFARGKAPLEYLIEKSVGIKRLVTIEQQVGRGAILERLEAMSPRRLALYKWQGLRVPFIGAGFYVAPHTQEDGTRRYRVGYGIHNSYLFALEQGGLAAFVLFFMFLYSCWRHLHVMIKPSQYPSDRAFAIGMYAYLAALVPVMLGGQVFWHGFGKVNYNSYTILLFMLACIPSWSDDYAYDNLDDTNNPGDTVY
jgi:hypothetical protein